MVGTNKPHVESLSSSAIVDIVPQIIWEVEPHGSYLYLNQQWYDYTGLTPEKSLGAAVWDSEVHPEDRALCIEHWAHANTSGQTLEIEYRIRSAGGEYHWFLARAVPRRNDDGVIISWIGISAYIENQRQKLAAFQRGEGHFQLLAEALPQVVWMADPGGRVHYFNPQWFRYTGLTREQSAGLEWLQAVHPEDRDQTRAQWLQAVEQGGPVKIEYRLFCWSDHAYHWHLIRGAALRDESRAILQWVGTMTDIDNQRRQSELLERLVRERTAELERSNRQLEEFAAVASHDLQEPLRKIQSFGERLQAMCSPALGDQGNETLNRILKSAVRMRTLINDLLAFSRISMTGQAFMLVDLASVATEVVSDLEGLIQQTGGSVQIDSLPTIHADPLQIRQLFQNLIGNGLKFHHPGIPPAVRLSARPAIDSGGTDNPDDDSWYEIAVDDNGIGFEEVHLDRIFQVFQRLHGRNKYEGTGMGLAICRKIVERHKGRITARSTPGQGSTFLVFLPAVQRASLSCRVSVSGDSPGSVATETQ